MPDDQTQVGGGTQPVAQTGQTGQPIAASGTQLAPQTAAPDAQKNTPEPEKESRVEDLLNMWNADEDVLGVSSIPVKPAEMDKPKPVLAPVVPPSTPSPSPAPAPAPAAPLPTPPPTPAPAPLAPPAPTVVPVPQQAPRPIPQTPAPTPPVAPQPPRPVTSTPPSAPTPIAPRPVSPSPAPTPVAQPRPTPPPTPAPSPLSPRPTPPSPMPQPAPRPIPPQAPVAPSAPAPRPTPPPTPAPSPIAPRPVPPSPAPSPMPPPRPTPPPNPAPTPAAPPRPVPPPAPSAPRPAPAPTPLTQKAPAKEAPIEAEVIEDEDKSNKAVADLLKSIKKEEGSAADDGETFMSQFKELLAELNISPRKILKWLGCIVVLIGVLYGGFALWTNYGTELLEKITSGTDSTATDSQPDETPDTQETVKRPRSQSGVTTPVESGVPESVSVGTGLATEPVVVPDTGIFTTVAIGQESVLATPFSYYVTQFKLLENAYGVDINMLLNQATDRRARYKAQLLLMNSLYAKANVTQSEMLAEIDSLNAELTKHSEAQTTAEKNFFDEVAALNGPATDVLLEQFTNEAQRVISLRARVRALQRVATLYKNALPRFEARIRDLELNQEPLISGLKVYDVAGSDLQLVVPVNSNSTSSSSASSAGTTNASSKGIFPIVSPQEFAGDGPDFITRPGGYQK